MLRFNDVWCNMYSMEKSIRFNIELTPEENEIIIAISKADGRSKKAQAEWIIRQYIKSKK